VTEQLFPTSQLLIDLTGVPVQPNKAIVGQNAFAHEAGIHQHGILKNALTYEIMTPHSVGVAGSNLILGKHSGRHALSLRCLELGYKLTMNQLERVYERFVSFADTAKKIQDEDLFRIIQNVLLQK
jgi:2-isopropylmalate synthase